MKNEDLMEMHSIMQHIVDRAEAIQKLIERKLSSGVDEKLFEYDLRKGILSIHTEVDYAEIISDYNYKVMRKVE
jgi:hypothetical protein